MSCHACRSLRGWPGAPDGQAGGYVSLAVSAVSQRRGPGPILALPEPLQQPGSSVRPPLPVAQHLRMGKARTRTPAFEGLLGWRGTVRLGGSMGQLRALWALEELTLVHLRLVGVRGRLVEGFEKVLQRPRGVAGGCWCGRSLGRALLALLLSASLLLPSAPGKSHLSDQLTLPAWVVTAMWWRVGGDIPRELRGATGGGRGPGAVPAPPVQLQLHGHAPG